MSASARSAQPSRDPHGEPGTGGPSRPVAVLDRVSVRYGRDGRWVPEALSLALEPGTTTALIGPSGCGKSTATLTLNGLVPHSVPSVYRGSVLVAGAEVADTDIAELARTVAMVMQDPDSQVVTGSVLDEVCYGLENLCLPVDQVEPRALAALRRTGTEHLAGSSPWDLSGGQRQRVVLAAALALEPGLLVLDEPTANLDPAGRAGFYSLLPGLTSAGTAVLVVEHDLDDLVGWLDQVVVLRSDGTTLAHGTPQEVLVDRADDLEAAGVRLPTAVRLGRLLSRQGRGVQGLEQALTPSRAAEVLARSTATAAPESPSAPGSAGPGTATLTAAAQGASAPPAHPPSAGSQEPVLRVEDLRVARGRGRRRREVLHGVDLEVRRGELMALVGANGSGKSTLLRALAGLEAWTQGSVVVAGRARRPGRTGREVTLVTQNPEHQLLEPTVAQEISHSMRLAREDPERIEAVTAGLLETFALTACAGTNPFLLSGGQQRRLTVASVLTEHRDVLCLDEPTFGQDHVHAVRLMQHLREVAARGSAVIVASHDMELVCEHADAVTVLHDGAVAARGPVSAVLGSLAATPEGELAGPAGGPGKRTAHEQVCGEPAGRTAHTERPSWLAGTAGGQAWAGLRPSALVRLSAEARALGAQVPQWTRWADVADGTARTAAEEAQ